MQWHEVQRDFIDRLRDAETDAPHSLGGTAASPATKRFNVYRNNVAVSLTEALAAGYPVVQKLVGDEFFMAMARIYVDQNVPRSPVMLHYGANFPEFIEAFEPARGLPFLADVARLEMAWRTAYNAADADAAGIDLLQSISPERLEDVTFSCHPSLQIISSGWPMASIWNAHQGDDDPTEAMQQIAAQARRESVIVVRPVATVDVRLISDATAQFFSSLKQGLTLGQAAEPLAQSETEDMGGMLQLLFSAGCVSGVSVQADR